MFLSPASLACPSLSSPSVPPFSMRIITIDHYMAPPLHQLVLSSPQPLLSLQPISFIVLPSFSSQLPSPAAPLCSQFPLPGLRVRSPSRQCHTASSRHAAFRRHSRRPKSLHARAPRVSLLAGSSDACRCGRRVGCVRQQVRGSFFHGPLCAALTGPCSTCACCCVFSF